MLLLLVPLLALAGLAQPMAEPARLAPRSLMLDLARAGNRLVAVGDRGHVLLSDDEGRSWRQVVVAARAMLTSVAFGDGRHGWAVGHDGTILATADGGESWQRQQSGADLETIFLAVSARGARDATAVGAYGVSLATDDGGKTWRRLRVSEEESHFNHLVSASDGTRYLAGEMGTLLISRGAASGWEKADLPYDGSLFGVLPLEGGEVLAFGLRGNVLASGDTGRTWEQREVPTPALLMAGVRLRSGPVVLAGSGGNFFISRDAGRTFAHWKPEAYNGGVSALLETTDGALLVAGDLGVARLQLPIK